MRNCPNCGKPNTDYKPASHRCTHCKVPVNVDQNTCWNCGGTEAETIKDDETE